MSEEPTYDDFGGSAILHIEVDGEPVQFGHPDSPQNGNKELTSDGEITFDVDGREVSIEVAAFIDTDGDGRV